MNPEAGSQGGDPSIDALFLSPHKFLGGPGSSGVLVFNERLYRQDLPPSVGGGGTVEYVSPVDQDFVVDIEEREKAGTPGVLQTMKAALAIELKQRVGIAAIEAREHELLSRALHRWRANSRIEILGDPDPTQRLGIVSFNVRDPRSLYLHPKFVTALLNDLFGIQSRAGCSCAGPYGHRLLGIDLPTSERYREWVRQGFRGIKPGWCRVGFHYTMDDAEARYVLDAVEFVANHGYRFLSQYDFDVNTGMWSRTGHVEHHQPFSLDAALHAMPCAQSALSVEAREARYTEALAEAGVWAERLGEPAATAPGVIAERFGDLQFFNVRREIRSEAPVQREST
jgi:hypothetical protein